MRWQTNWKRSLQLSIQLSALALLGFPGAAFACLSVMVATGNVNLGNYNPLSSSGLSSPFTVRLDCITDNITPTILLPYSVGIEGLSSSNPASMKLTSGDYSMDYSVYKSASLNLNWGPLGGSATVSGEFPSTILPLTQVLTGYLNVPARQNVPIGMYTDQLSVTIQF